MTGSERGAASGPWTLLTLAPVGAAWPDRLARWAMDGTLPVTVTKCVSAAEVRARLGGGRPWSALVVDGGSPVVDLDLEASVLDAGAQLLRVLPAGSEPRPGGLPTPLRPADLLAGLERVAAPVSPARVEVRSLPRQEGPSGRLVVVTGPGGTGASTVAMALAQGLGAGGSTVLADLCRRADLGVLHDAPDVGPGLVELVDAHRRGSVDPDGVRALTWLSESRRYHLLLGMRRPSDWSALRPRAVSAALRSLADGWRWVVADVDPDTEGERETGSVDVEERHRLTRHALDRADLVVVVGRPDLRGMHATGRLVRELVAHVGAARLQPVVSHAPRSPRRRSELARVLAELVTGVDLASPVFVRERTAVEDAVVEGVALPTATVAEVTDPVRARLERLDRRPATDAAAGDLVSPGSLGVA